MSSLLSTYDRAVTMSSSLNDNTFQVIKQRDVHLKGAPLLLICLSIFWTHSIPSDQIELHGPFCKYLKPIELIDGHSDAAAMDQLPHLVSMGRSASQFYTSWKLPANARPRKFLVTTVSQRCSATRSRRGGEYNLCKETGFYLFLLFLVCKHSTKRAHIITPQLWIN